MKFLAILCLAGLAIASRSSSDTDSEWYWETGKDYVYSYSGRLLTGIPELSDDTFSGIGINCTVYIQRTEGNTFYLSIKDSKYVRINEKLESDSTDSNNWRELRLPELNEISGEYRSTLEKPIMFTMTNGEISTAKISRGEPVWSVNFKKALALQFQTKLDVTSKSWRSERDESSDESVNYWKVKEETIDGVCENIYEIRELPKYMIVDRPEMVPYPEACTEEKYFGLTKTKDVAKCEKKSTFNYFAPGRFGHELSGNNMDQWSRSSNTRYIACGSRGRLVIQTIINDGELNQNLLGYKTERFVTGTMQVLHLKEVRTATPIHTPEDFVTVTSMMFEYSRESFTHQASSPMQNLNQEEKIKVVKSGLIPEHLAGNPEVVRQTLPRNFMYGVSPNDVSSEEIMSQLKKYISQIVRELTEGIDTKDKQITFKVLAVSRGFLMLKTKEEISTVYQQLKSEFSSNPEDLVSLKNVFFDTLLMSGCPKCLYFIKESIMSGEMTSMQISNFFIWMPNYVKLPTKEVLSTLYELVTCDKIRNDDILYNKAIMGFSTLLNRACISNYRMTMYPTNVFGEFCNPDSEIVVSKWIPYLVHDLKYTKSFTKRNEIIVSLGLMQHKSIIAELIPFVEGSFEDTTKLNRYLAIHSLSNCAASMDPTHVVPIFISILSNPSECSTLRIAAFNSLMKQNPSMSVMHKIASLTWTIKDEEILKVINIAFFTLSKESELFTYDETTLSLPKKAFLVYPLIKKTEGIIPTSATVYSSDHLTEMGVGYDAKTTWSSSKTSFIPQDIYTEMTYFMNQYRFTPISLGLRLSGAESLYSQIEKLFKPIESSQWNEEESSEDDQEEEGEERSQEWEKVIEQLKLKVRENGPMDGAFFLRWFESSPMFYNFDKLTPKQLREKIAPLLSNPRMIKDKLCGNFPLNFQQTLDRTPTVFMIPSDMGFPIVVEVHMPVAVSVRGNLIIKCETEIPSISLKATVVSNSQYSGWVGTSIPFTKEYTVTGVQEQFVVNLPVAVEMKFDVPSGQVSFSFKPETGSINRPIDFFHYHVKPFTTYKKVSDLTPLTLTPNVKFIRSEEEVKKVSYSFGDYLGFSLKSTIETESPYTDMKSFLDIMELYNNNPLNALRFLWTSPALTEEGTPSLRSHEHCLSFDPTTSPTKEIKFDFQIGYGKKEEGQHSIKYQNLKIKNNQNKQQQQRNQNNKMNLSPFEVESEDNEHIHPRRQEKIKKALTNLNVESGHAVTVVCTTTLMGSRPRSWSYIMTFAVGKDSLSHGVIKSKWNVHLETETSSTYPVKEICIKGEVDTPVLPLWNIEELRSYLVDFRYVNEISFGKSSCSESSIKVVGTAKVSHEQKEFSRQSDDARKCHKLLESGAPGAKLSDECERTRLQAQTVDEVEYIMEYNNIPREVSVAEKKFLDYLKVFLWPYIKAVKSDRSNQMMIQEENNSYKVKCRVLFHRETPSFDLIINKPEESIVFSQIRIPYPLNLVFPMKAGRNNAYLALKSVTGESLTPECKIGSESLTTFDNKSLPLKMDDCFHLLSADCSKVRSFGILARTLKRDQTKRELKVFLGKASMLLTPTESRSENSDIRITVDGQELQVPVNTWKSIVVRGQEYGSIFRSSDNVFQLKCTQYNAQFRFDGSRVVIYASNLLKGKLCGLCGNFNQLSKDDMTGPAKCIHVKPETHVASYRVQTHQCDRLPQKVQRDLEEEKQKCVQYKEIPTKVTKSLKAQAGKCTLRKHIMVQKSGQVCISKNVVTECQSSCKVAQGQQIAKSVEFTCLPNGRVADLYAEKANNGQELPELRNMETTFQSKVEQPKRCVSSILKE